MKDSWTQTPSPRDRSANSTRLPQRIGVTASGDCYHVPGCNHIRGRKARVYRPCLDCLDLPPDPRGELAPVEQVARAPGPAGTKDLRTGEATGSGERAPLAECIILMPSPLYLRAWSLPRSRLWF